MTEILLPEGFPRQRLVFYLAMEEYLASLGQEAFFTWTSRPTVIFGRNQDMSAEVNLEWCKSHDVELYRRKSGGGCVYSDSGNLMISYIVPETGVEKVFGDYIGKLCSALSSLGLPAVASERNDVLVEGRKVSGSAFSVLPHASIIHSTLLVNSNLDDVESAITPPREKLLRHAVASVRQRVANLADTRPDITFSDIRKALNATFLKTGKFPSTRHMSDEEIDSVRKIEQTYLDPEFLLGK